jgi:hypothetical protein
MLFPAFIFWDKKYAKPAAKKRRFICACFKKSPETIAIILYKSPMQSLM